MAKVLIVVRHAKADKAPIYPTDFERPLEPRGVSDARAMGRYLAEEKHLNPDLLISSTALRARETAVLIAEQLQYPEAKIRLERSMYASSPSELKSIVREAEDSAETIMIFGHNPEFTEFSERLTGVYFDNMATCGVCCIAFDTDRWSDIDWRKGKLLWYEYPKIIHKE